MKRLLTAEAVPDAETRESLSVIDVFDRLVAEQAGPRRLVEVAAGIARRPVGVAEALSDFAAAVTPDGDEVPDAEAMAEAVAGAAVAARLRGRHHRLLETARGPLAAASVETATGRLGFVWAGAGGRPWTTLDGVVLERLLAGDVHSEEEATLAARRAGLDDARPWLVLVASERPAAASSPEAIVAGLLRALHAHGLGARGTTIARRPALVVEDGAALDAAVADAIDAARARGYALDVGLGERAPLLALSRSLHQAREALVLGGLSEEREGATRFRDLGILHLLAQIPAEAVCASPDVQRLAELDGSSGGITDLRLLEAYCETASLRQTAARLFVHHSSVDYRVKRIQEALGLSLTDPADRLRALVAVKLLRIERLRRP